MTKQDSKRCDTVTQLTTPITIDTIDGETKAAAKASVKLPLIEISDAVVLEKAQESVLPTCEICKDELEYYQDKHGAAIINTETKEVFECPQEGNIHRFPLTSDKTINRQEVHVAEIAVAKERMASQNFNKLKHQKHAHKPRMPIGMCEV